MDPALALGQQTAQLLELTRRDPKAACEALDALAPEARVAIVCESPIQRRRELLDAMSHPEQVIPLLPEAELCFTAKAIGLADASWMLAYATAEQVIACLDLDGWQGLVADHDSLEQWMAAISATGEESLLRTSQSIDPELLVLILRERITTYMNPGGAEGEDFEVPEGARTLDGQFYVVARRENDDLEWLMKLLDVLFRMDYWLYFRALQGTVWELDSDLAEWALRWRSGRLEDLGFPTWDESMRIYGYVRPEKRADLPENEDGLAVEEWDLAVWIPHLPVASEAGHSVFRAAVELEAGERQAFFFAFIAIANRVAVADHLPLGDAETLPGAIEKAARLVSLGLEHIASERSLPAVDVLKSAGLPRLFRVGASIERDAFSPDRPSSSPPSSGIDAESGSSE